MRLYIVRHGRAAAAEGGDDFSRSLTERGERELLFMAAKLKEQGCAPELIIHSPLVRTTQTAALLHRGLGSGQVLVSERLKPGASVNNVLEEISGLTEFRSLMLVGHAPDVSLWSYRFLGHEPERQLRFEPGTVAEIHFSGKVAPKGGNLEYFCAPGEICTF